jgi:hypothetical protein
MKSKKCILYLFLLIPFLGMKAQVAINTQNPAKSTLEVVPTDPDNPTAMDGVLIPKVPNFPATNPTSAGNLIFFKKDANTLAAFNTKPDGFYFWNGNEWVMLLTANAANTKQKIYCATGQGFGTLTNDWKQVLLTIFTYDNTTVPVNEQFTLSGYALTVGKAGTYLVSAGVSSRRGDAARTTAGNQTNFIAEVRKNGAVVSPAISGQSNTSTEVLSAAQVVINTLATFNKGDKLTFWVKQESADATIPYTANGNGYLTLYYLHN